jgi:cell division protein FtsX
LVRLTGVDLLSDTTLANPLPRSFVLSFRTDSISTSAFEEIEKQLRTFPAIQQVNYSRDWLVNAESTRSQVHRIGVVIGALIAVAALLNLANNIRLMSRTSAVGIRQARLMGAGKLFLSSPYIFEGFLIGGVAAVTGWIALFYFQQSVRIAELQPTFPVVKDIIWFCLLSAVIGGISGLLGVRSLLKW